MKKIVYICLIVSIIISFNISVFANNISEINSKITKAENELGNVKSEMSEEMKAVEELTIQIAELNVQISDLGVRLDNLNKEIEKKKKNIEQKQKEYDERQALLDKRLVAQYTTGKTTYLDVLLSSSSITDFISNYYLIEQLSECDSVLLNQIQTLKTQIETEKAELESTKADVETTKKSIEINKETLERTKGDKSKKIELLTSEEKKLQADLDEYEKDKQAALAEAVRIAQEYAESGSSSGNFQTIDYANYNKGDTSDYGFICPLEGRTSDDITTGYYAYSGHTGVDFARNYKGAVEGEPVMAAKDGVVIESRAIKNSSGNYISYGECIKIKHYDGTMTVYAHMQPGSRRVDVGESVSQGEQIGNVGTTGNSTGPHLHFEIYIGGSRVNPANYLP